MFNKFFTMMLVVTSLFGCGQDDKPKSTDQAPSPRAQKPLPNECFEQAIFSASWPQDPDAFEYEVSYGVPPNDFYLTRTYAGTTTEISQPLERGATYAIRVTKKNTDFSVFKPEEITLTIPDCESRSAWKAEHPDYEEPALFNIEWKKTN